MIRSISLCFFFRVSYYIIVAIRKQLSIFFSSSKICLLRLVKQTHIANVTKMQCTRWQFGRRWDAERELNDIFKSIQQAKKDQNNATKIYVQQI